MTNRVATRTIATGFALLLTLVLAANCWAQSPPTAVVPVDVSTFSPASPPAHTIRQVYFLVLGISAFVFLLVEGLLIYSIIRFRSRDDKKTAEPPQVYGSKPIEVAWTLGPTLIVFVLFLVVARAVAEIKPPPRKENDNPLRVTVVGHQWWWEFRYHRDVLPDIKALDAHDAQWPAIDFITANELIVPAGRQVELRLESADVVHSFWVPRLAGKTDVVPGQLNTMWFNADMPGWFEGQCAEFCGLQHAKMLLRVNATTPGSYVAWSTAQRQPAAEVSELLAVNGRQLFLSLSCVNCHAVRGTSARGTFGPDLTHLMSRETIASGILKNDRANLIAWLRNPDDFKPGCFMPNMTLSAAQLESLVDYLTELK